MRKSTRHNRLRIESLEGRCMLAGNVLANLYGDLLLIRGDAAANDIALTAGAVNQQVVVTGNATNVNGTATPKTFNNVRAVQVLLNDGDDVFAFDNGATAYLRTLTVDGGRGNDTIGLDNIRAGTIVVNDSLGGNDVVNIGANAAVAARYAVSIYTNGGDDTITVNNTNIGGSLVINAGTGTAVGDSVTVTTTNVAGSVAIVTLAGDDTVTMRDVNIGGALSIVTGGNSAIGVDLIELTGVTAGAAIVINSGEGADTVTLTTVTTSSLSIVTAGGVDAVTLTTVNVDFGLVIDTGNGADTVTLDDVNAFSLVVNTGVGNDIDTVTIGGSGDGLDVDYFTLLTGAGNDVVTLSDSIIARNLVFDLGLGNDTFTALAVNTAVPGFLLSANGSLGNDTLNGFNQLNFQFKYPILFETVNA